MGTQIILSSPNYTGFIADITFNAQTGGTVNLGSHVIPYTVDLDYYYGTYQLCYSAFNVCCDVSIVAPTPTPTATSTSTPTPTATSTSTPTPTPTITPTPTNTFYYHYAIGRASVPNAGPSACSSIFSGTLVRSIIPLDITKWYCDSNGYRIRVDGSVSAGSYAILTVIQGPFNACLDLSC
jgi:hypothetical protein